jgi:hypothetical protein
MEAREEEIEVQSVEETEFSDASLGVPEAGKMYAQVVTPGYVIRLSLDGETHTYHATGDRVVVASPEEGQRFGQAQSLVDKAVTDLVERTGVAEEEIKVESLEEAEFSDTSLGVPEPGKMYAQVITPGYIICLSVEEETYTYHAAGDRVVLASPSQAATDASLRVVHVRVAHEEEKVTVWGEASLPDGTCIQTQLLLNDEVVSWWPSGACAQVQDGGWEMDVSLPPAGAPDGGDFDEASQAMYVLRATAEEYPEIEAARFPLDLYGPPSE